MVYIVYKYISTHKYTSIISRLPTCGVMCTVQYSLIVALVIASELTAGILLILSKPDVSLQYTAFYVMLFVAPSYVL